MNVSQLTLAFLYWCLSFSQSFVNPVRVPGPSCEGCDTHGSVSNDKSTAQKLTSFARELPKEPGPFSNSIEDFKQIDFLVILLTNIAVQQDFWTKIQIAMPWHI